jgi:hypothetical protein
MNGIFSNVFELQRELLGHDPRVWRTDEEKVAYLGLLCLHTFSEVNESLEHVDGWKSWAGGTAYLDHEGFTDELVDVILLAVSSFICGGGTAGTLLEKLDTKSTHNLDRLSLKGGKLT